MRSWIKQFPITHFIWVVKNLHVMHFHKNQYIFYCIACIWVWTEHPKRAWVHSAASDVIILTLLKTLLYIVKNLSFQESNDCSQEEMFRMPKAAHSPCMSSGKTFPSKKYDKQNPSPGFHTRFLLTNHIAIAEWCLTASDFIQGGEHSFFSLLFQ